MSESPSAPSSYRVLGRAANLAALSMAGVRPYIYQAGQLVPGTHFRVVRPLGYGGGGSVYEVADELLGIVRVIKVIHPEILAVTRRKGDFAKEARILAQLKHEHIVEVYAAGWTQEHPPLFYFSMEKLVGYSLRSVLDKHLDAHEIPPLEFALTTAAQVLRALAYAHDRKVVHRDVKPENIFIHRYEPGKWRAKLLDFGVGAILSEARTTLGGFSGTYRYAAPEQFESKTRPNPASDVYGCGVVLYEMILGRGPFDDRENEIAITKAHMEDAPEAPSKFVSIPRALDELVLKMLEKDPAKRGSDCRAIVNSLERIQSERFGLDVPATYAARTSFAFLGAEPPVDSVEPHSVSTGLSDVELLESGHSQSRAATTERDSFSNLVSVDAFLTSETTKELPPDWFERFSATTKRESLPSADTEEQPTDPMAAPAPLSDPDASEQDGAEPVPPIPREPAHETPPDTKLRDDADARFLSRYVDIDDYLEAEVPRATTTARRSVSHVAERSTRSSAEKRTVFINAPSEQWVHVAHDVVESPGPAALPLESSTRAPRPNTGPLVRPKGWSNDSRAEPARPITSGSSRRGPLRSTADVQVLSIRSAHGSTKREFFFGSKLMAFLIAATVGVLGAFGIAALVERFLPAHDAGFAASPVPSNVAQSPPTEVPDAGIVQTSVPSAIAASAQQSAQISRSRRNNSPSDTAAVESRSARPDIRLQAPAANRKTPDESAF